MRDIKVILVDEECTGRLSPQEYVLIKFDKYSGTEDRFFISILDAGIHAGAACVRLKGNPYAEEVVDILRRCTTPEEVYITAEAYEKLKGAFFAQAVPHRMTVLSGNSLGAL